MTSFTIASDFANRGFPVIPLFGTDENGKCLCGDPDCKNPGKHPKIKGGLKAASVDQNFVAKHFNGKPQNVGIKTGEAYEDGFLYVLDVDVKKDKDGTKFLDEKSLIEGLDLPSTYTVKTPTGGLHYYFKTSQPLKSGVNIPAKGIDIRGAGGYVVSPLSTIGGTEYEVINDADITFSPKWLTDLIVDQSYAQRETERGDDLDADLMDSQQAIDRAINYLKDAPIAVEGSGGDTQTFKTACRLIDEGLTPVTAHELLLNHWNDRCIPPWDPEELFTKVMNADTFRENERGSRHPAMDFDVVDEEAIAEAEAAKPCKFSYSLANVIQPNLTKSYLIEDVLGLGAASTVYGAPNAGKTFAVMDMAWHIATGRKWCNKRVVQGAVLYLALEGGFGIDNRIAALKEHYGDQDSQIPFAIVKSTLELSTKTDAKELLKLIQQLEDETGHPLRLIVVDTFARAWTGDENSATEVGKVIKTVDYLREKTKAHVLNVHHAGKDKSKGARGSNALLGAIDTEIFVDGANGKGQIAFKKQRDMEIQKPIKFSLKKMILGQDDDGVDVTSCVLLKSETSPQEDFIDEHKLGDPKLIILWDAIEKFCADNGRNNVTVDEMFDICEELNNFHKDTNIQLTKSEDTNSKKTLYRRLYEQLTNKGLIRKINRNQWVVGSCEQLQTSHEQDTNTAD